MFAYATPDLGGFACPLLLVWGFSALAGHFVGSRKLAGLDGMVMGLLFGPLGVLVATQLDNRKKCLHCRSRVESDASICPCCQSLPFTPRS